MVTVLKSSNLNILSAHFDRLILAHHRTMFKSFEWLTRFSIGSPSTRLSNKLLIFYALPASKVRASHESYQEIVWCTVVCALGLSIPPY